MVQQHLLSLHEGLHLPGAADLEGLRRRQQLLQVRQPASHIVI